MIFLYDEQPGERFIPQWYPSNELPKYLIKITIKKTKSLRKEPDEENGKVEKVEEKLQCINFMYLIYFKKGFFEYNFPLPKVCQ